MSKNELLRLWKNRQLPTVDEVVDVYGMKIPLAALTQEELAFVHNDIAELELDKHGYAHAILMAVRRYKAEHGGMYSFMAISRRSELPWPRPIHFRDMFLPEEGETLASCGKDWSCPVEQ